MTQDTSLNLKRIFCTAMIAYAVLIVSFYFLAGDQLRFRSSRGNVAMLPSDSGTVELTEGAVIEQTFCAEIQRLESVSAQFSSYYRTEHGTVIMELLKDDEVLMRDSFDSSEIQDGSIITMTADEPIETVCGVTVKLRIHADPAAPVTVMMNTTAPQEEFSLTIAGAPGEGTTCFSAQGTDYIWTGLHYWKFAIVLGALIAALLLLVTNGYKRGKHSYIISVLMAVKKYRFLIRQLVSRDFKKKYKRSVLGVFWSFLNPLLTMLVQYFVFSTIFKSDIPQFAAYLITGTVMFNFFSESCGMTLMSILDNSGLITKVYMPKYIYPLTRTISSLINLLIAIIPMLLVCILTGVQLHKSTVLALFFYVCLFIFCLGLGMLLCTSMVFFRDTLFLWNAISMMWMYATPIFYPETIIPERLRFVLVLNPLYHFIRNARMCILEGLSPEPVVYVRCLGLSLLMLVIGTVVFYRNQDKFVLYF